MLMARKQLTITALAKRSGVSRSRMTVILSNTTMAVQRLAEDERAKFNLGVHDSDGTNF